jgi:cytochrome bd ubiquinol oxidase subunit II
MLETIWFALWGILWAVYFMLDGFDLGAGMLTPFIAKNETDKRTIYGSIGPFWDGNEVWLLTAGGVTFAAFPAAYAAIFSSFYSPLMLLLFALILRGVSLELRGKVVTEASRRLCDMCIFLGSLVPSLLLGVAFANIFKGIPIDVDGVFQGTILTFLNPYGLMGGLLFISLFLVHGALWLAIKSDGDLQERAAVSARGAWVAALILAVLFLAFTALQTKLFVNYLNNPVLFLIPLCAVFALLLTRLFMSRAAWWKAWFASSLTIVTVTLFGVTGLYPNLLPSSLDAAFSLTVANSASSPLTLKIMLGVALIMVPIVVIYQAWAYSIFKDKVKAEDVDGYEEGY